MPEPRRVCVGGLSHKTAPVELREHVALRADDAVETARRLKAEPAVDEAVALSTCNRTELYVVTGQSRAARRIATACLADCSNASRGDIERSLYWLSGDAAMAHLFRVVAGLDSLVVGESQIVAQVRAAYRDAHAAECAGPILNRLFAHALATGKRVRAETALGSTSLSVSRAAVELAGRELPSLMRATALIVGAGETSELSARELRAAGAARVLIAGRRAVQTEAAAARIGGEAVSFADIDEHLGSADIVLSSTSAPHYVLTADRLRRVVGGRAGRRLLLIDLAVPRDIDPRAATLPDVSLFNIDDLVAVLTSPDDPSDDGLMRPAHIIETELGEMRRWLSGLTVTPTIRALHARAEEIRTGELGRLRSRLRDLDDDQQKAVEQLTRSIVNKLLHGPTTQLKASAEDTACDGYADVLRVLFGLDVAATCDTDEPGGDRSGDDEAGDDEAAHSGTSPGA